MLAAAHQKICLWAENCPENFENRAALVGAEIARIEGRELDAQRLYEQAIRSARENGFIQNEGIANELAAKFYLGRGYETSASAYLRNARYCYLRWGALGKVAAIGPTPSAPAQERLFHRHDWHASLAAGPWDGHKGVARGLRRDRVGEAN